jgi:hemin uptake protein HemP
MNSEPKHNIRKSSDNAALKNAADARRISVADNQIDSRELFAGVREITIAHGKDTYRLRLTSQNKLILTK